MREIEEHDTVIVETEGLERFGTIVHIYPNTITYEVEFIDQLGDSYVETIQGDHVKMILKNNSLSLSESEAINLLNARLMRIEKLTEEEIAQAKNLQTELKNKE